jgi:hypothetical protein
VEVLLLAVTNNLNLNSPKDRMTLLRTSSNTWVKITTRWTLIAFSNKKMRSRVKNIIYNRWVGPLWAKTLTEGICPTIWLTALTIRVWLVVEASLVTLVIKVAAASDQGKVSLMSRHQEAVKFNTTKINSSRVLNRTQR